MTPERWMQPSMPAGSLRFPAGNLYSPMGVLERLFAYPATINWRNTMGFGRGLLLWLLGIPLPIILLLALFWR
jgi:hypothetical protein